MKSSFNAYIPKYPINRYVQLIWISSGGLDQTKSRVLPNGTIELILNFGGIQKTLNESSFTIKNTYKNFWVAGLQKGPIIIQSENDTNLLGIRFKPGGAFPFFKFPIIELTDHVTDVEWLKAELDQLKEQIFEIGDQVQIFNKVEQYLFKKLATTEINPATTFVIDKIVADADNLSLDELIFKTGYSHKHFLSLFKQQAGVTPKTLQRILRFQKVIRRANTITNPKWSDILYDYSFFDPSHFVSDFKKLSGITPDQYLLSKTFDENHCIIR